jgi:tRNA nucleotidyltransferase (CCA-adding enzyme)
MHVVDVMRRSFEVVHLHEPLARVDDRMMAEGSDALPVVDGDRVVGLVTRDAVARALAARAEDTDIAVRDIAARPPPHCLESDSVDEARAAMRTADTNCLVVLDANEELVGLVHEADLPRPGPADVSAPTPLRGADDAKERHPGLKVYTGRPRLRSTDG